MQHRRWHVFARVYRRSIVQPNGSINYPIPVGSRRSNRSRRQLVSSSRATAFAVTERQRGSSRESSDLFLSLSRFEKAEIFIGSINAARGCNRASSRRVSRLVIVGGFQPPGSFLSALLRIKEPCVCVSGNRSRNRSVIERSNGGISFFARIDRGRLLRLRSI